MEKTPISRIVRHEEFTAPDCSIIAVAFIKSNPMTGWLPSSPLSASKRQCAHDDAVHGTRAGFLSAKFALHSGWKGNLDASHK